MAAYLNETAEMIPNNDGRRYFNKYDRITRMSQHEFEVQETKKPILQILPTALKIID